MKSSGTGGSLAGVAACGAAAPCCIDTLATEASFLAFLQVLWQVLTLPLERGALSGTISAILLLLGRQKAVKDAGGDQKPTADLSRAQHSVTDSEGH